MRVQEVMTIMPETCTIDDSAADAARIMWQRDCGAVPVVDRDGRIAGMVTDRDICMGAYFNGTPLSLIQVSNIMCDDLCTCEADDDVRDAERLMRDRQIRRLPVVDERRTVVGILSLSDVAQSLKPNGRSVEANEGRDFLETVAAVSQPRGPRGQAASGSA